MVKKSILSPRKVSSTFLIRSFVELEVVYLHRSVIRIFDVATRTSRVDRTLDNVSRKIGLPVEARVGVRLVGCPVYRLHVIGYLFSAPHVTIAQFTTDYHSLVWQALRFG